MLPVGRYGVSAAAKHAGAGGPGCHRRQERAKRACGAPDREEEPRATRQAHSRLVTELSRRNDTALTEFSEDVQ